MATIKDIAAKLGISYSTVSKGLNGASDISESTRQAVLETAIELGYKPKSFQERAGRKICIMVENMNYENIDEFGYDIISGFEQAAVLKHYQVTVVSTNLTLQSKERYDTFMLKNGYCGAFLLGFELHDDYVSQLDHTTIPTVLLDNYIPGNVHIGYVGTDNYEGIQDAVTHLKDLGHQHIAFLNGSKNSMITQKRLAAFQHSMQQCNLAINPHLIAFGHYQINQAKTIVPAFIKEKATAIICASDFIASGVIKELSLLGLHVPEDISVIGYDDLPFARYLTPPLTTIHQNRKDMGKSAFLLLDGLIHDVPISRIELRPEFIIRESTGTSR